MAQKNPETGFELMFESAPISLWLEDYSALKDLFDTFNRQTLSMFALQSQGELRGQLGAIFRDEMHDSFAEQLIDLWDGKTGQLREVMNCSLTGELIYIHMQFAVLSAHQATWGLVLVSLTDITARKIALLPGWWKRHCMKPTRPCFASKRTSMKKPNWSVDASSGTTTT